MQVKSITSGAIIPTTNQDGSYSLYSCSDACIPKGHTLEVSTGVRIRIPGGYFAWIQSGASASKRGISTQSFCSAHVNNDDIPEMRVNLHNGGLMSCDIQAGDEIGRMYIIRCETPQIEQVTEFHGDTHIEYKRPAPIPIDGVTSIASSTDVWFKRLYIENPAKAIEEHFDIDMRASLDALKQTAEYKHSQRKVEMEVGHVWNTMDDAKKLNIKSKFLEYQRTIYNLGISGVSSVSATEKPPAKKDDKGKCKKKPQLRAWVAESDEGSASDDDVIAEEDSE